jgi:hypothetical protein
VALLALTVREMAHGEKIGCLEQSHAVFERKAFSRIELLGDVSKACGFEA